jgi:hypothetical protein
MANLRLEVSLLCSDPSGTCVDPAVFPGTLSSEHGTYLQLVVGTGRWQASRISFLPVVLEPRSPEPHEAFHLRAQQLFGNVAAFLARQPSDVFLKLQESGLHVELLVQSEIDQDQIELFLPAVLLHECALAGLDIHLLSND